MRAIPTAPGTAAPLRVAAACALAAWLVGCAAPGPAPGPDGAVAAAHQRWLEGLSHWRASGRVAVQVPGDGWSASLQWRQGADGYRIALSGPFGQGALRIEGGDGGVVLRTADGRVAQAASAEQLIGQELRIEVPVSALRYWLLGRPAPGIPVAARELDAGGNLARLEQAGWVIRYDEYVAVDGGLLPARLEVRRDDTRARFLVSAWQLGS